MIHRLTRPFSGLLLLAPSLLFMESTHAQEIVGHRGASYDAPENTLASFELAWRREADVIEGDFFLTADDQIICTHDKSTKRLAPGQPEKIIPQSTLQELQTLDVGSWKAPKYSDQRMPTLAQVLETIPEGKRIYIEVKCGPEIIPHLEKVLRGCGLKDRQIVIISFDDEVVRASRKTMPQFKSNWITSYKKDAEGQWRPTPDEVLATLKRTGATGLACKAELEVVDQAFVDRCKSEGFEFHCWTVNDADDARALAKIGIDSITTDRPAVIRKAIER